MANKKKKVKSINLDLYRQSRSREWVVKPVTKIVPNKKKSMSKRACRRKGGTDE